MAGSLVDSSILTDARRKDAEAAVTSLMDEFGRRMASFAQPTAVPQWEPARGDEPPSPSTAPTTSEPATFGPAVPSLASLLSGSGLERFIPGYQQPTEAGTRVPETPSGTPSAMPTGQPTGAAAPEPPRQTMSQPSSGGEDAIDNSSRQSFVRTAWPLALRAAKGDARLAELMLAKAISENGSIGTGRPIWANNVSGIKGTGTAGSVDADTWEATNSGPVNIRDRFAAFNTLQDGFDAFPRFLEENSRYTRALENYRRTGDSDTLFREINEAGYATDPVWWKKVQSIRDTQVAPVIRQQGDARQSMNAAAPAASSPPAPWASVDASPSTGAQDAGVMMRAGLTQPADEPPVDGGARQPTRPGRFIPEPNIVPLSDALAGRDYIDDPQYGEVRGDRRTPYTVPGTRNRAVRGDTVEYTERVPPSEMGPFDPAERNRPVPSDEGAWSESGGGERYPNLINDQIQYRQPLGAANTGPDTFETGSPAPDLSTMPLDPDQGPRESGYTVPAAVGTGAEVTNPTPPSAVSYDPRIVDSGPREGGAFQMPVGGMDDPGTQISVPVIPPSPYAPGQAASMEPAPDRFAPTPEAPTGTQRFVTAAGSVLSEAGSKAVDAAMEASRPPQTPMEIAQSSLPTARGIQIYQAAQGAFGDVVGRRVGEALGLSDEEMAFGISPQDVAGFAGQLILDPTNVGGGGAAKGVLELGAEAAQAGARMTGRGARAVGTRVGEAVAANAERLASADARMAAEGSMMAPASFGMSPGRPRGRPTVEVLEEALREAYADAQQARAAGNEDAAQEAMGYVRRIENALIDARNARARLEPAIESDIGRRIERTPPMEETLDDAMSARFPSERVRPEQAADLGGPVGVPVYPGERVNATPGLSPGRASGFLDTASRDIGSALGTSTFGAAAGAAMPADSDEERRQNALIGAGAGLVAGPAARRLMGRGRGGALATPGFGPSDTPGLGNVPPSKLREPTLPGMEPPYVRPDLPNVSDAPNRPPVLGDVPPSAIRELMLPGLEPPAPRPIGEVAAALEIPPSLNTPALQRALTAAERRAEAMQRRGLTAPSAWDWIKQAGYAGIYGPTTFASSVVGGAQELLLSQPKEAVRALVSGRPGAYGAQVKGQLRAMPEGLQGLLRVLWPSDSAAAAARSGGSQGTANLSERVVNPTGHFVARGLERPGEILTEAPDAVFRPMFLAAGMQREAHTIAAEAGLRGPRAAAYADELMQQAEALRLNPDTAVASEAVRRIVDAGAKYADDLGYKGKPGAFGQWLGQMAKRDDPIGVLASFLVPFPSMAARMTTASARSTPGIGLLPAVRRGQPSRFDVVYDQAFGTAIAAGIAYWAFNGGVTGSGPSDPEQRRMMMDQGWQPNSTLVGGHYVPNRLFQRFQPMLDTAGELHDALAYGKKDRKWGELVSDLTKRGRKIATDQVGLSGLADLDDMLSQGFAAQFPGWAARSGLRYVPYAGIIRAAATATDPTQRKPDGWGDEAIPATAISQQAQTAVPGLRQGVPAAQDVLGREAPNPQYGLGALIPRVTSRRDDPTIRAFQDAGVDIGQPRDQLTIDGIEVPLSPREQMQWQRFRGAILERYAGGMTARPWWSKPEARKLGMEQLLREANAAADEQMQAAIGSAALRDRIRQSVQKRKVS